MSILYNKTALKKMKKDDLIDMFLNRQANVLDDDIKKEASTELEKEYSRRISELIEIVNEKNQQIHNLISEHEQEEAEQHQLIEGFKEQIDSHQAEIKKLKEEKQEGIDIMRDVKEAMEEMFEEIEGLKEEIQKYENSSLRTMEATPSEILAEMEEYEDKIESLEHDNDELAEQFKILNDFCGGIPNDDGQAIVDYICSLSKYEDQCIELEAELKKLKGS